MREISGLLRTSVKTGLTTISARFGPQHWPLAAPRLWILMYHRIITRAQAASDREEPGMYVTPETFTQHLAWLRQNFEIVPLADWVERAQAGQPLPRKACAITFDDGWLDNYVNALPVLQAHKTPATVFVVSHMIGSSVLFWPNRISRLLKRAPEFTQSDASCDWLRGLAAAVPGGVASAIGHPEAGSALIHACKMLPDDEIASLLAAAEDRSGISAASERILMNWEELRTMVASGLVDVGSHTCHHFRLRGDLAPETLEREIVDSRARLETELGKPVTLFCYPNGDYTAQAAALVQQHYGAAVTTARGINRRGDPLNTLRRIGMHEDVSNTRTRFFARLSGWR